MAGGSVSAALAPAYGSPPPAQRPIDRVLDALHAKGGPVRKVGRETVAVCPAHDDHHPSLNVGEAPDGRVLLVCRSQGCQYGDVMRALNLDPRDGFPDGDRQPAWGPQAVRRHEYRAPDGTVLGWAERQRTERPAKFLPRQPDGSTGSSDRLRASLYNAAALRDRPEDLVVLVEGEQDADAVLLHTGALAVTNPNGAGNFTAMHARQLAGRTVQVVLDRDEAGRERLAVLHRAGLWQHCTVRAICEPPPPHNDIAEYLAAGGQVEDMTPVEAPGDVEPATADAPPVRLQFQTVAELCAEVDAMGPRRYLVRGLWPAGAYGVHAAEPKAGKTWNGLDLAVAVAAGRPFLGEFPVDTSGPVIVFAGEGGKGSVVRRLRAVAAAHGVRLEDLPITVCCRAPHLSDELVRAEQSPSGRRPPGARRAGPALPCGPRGEVGRRLRDGGAAGGPPARLRGRRCVAIRSDSLQPEGRPRSLPDHRCRPGRVGTGAAVHGRLVPTHRPGHAVHNGRH